MIHSVYNEELKILETQFKDDVSMYDIVVYLNIF